ncbi:MAG: response regulator [Pseudomonadota bacterium]
MNDILILDDDYDLAKSWEEVLTAAGGDVVITHSSKDAIEHIKQRKFRAVILDLMIGAPLDGEPDSGIHFLRALREEDCAIPKLIGVSGYYGQDDGEMAKNLFNVYGVKHVLLKPFDPQELVKLV